MFRGLLFFLISSTLFFFKLSFVGTGEITQHLSAFAAFVEVLGSFSNTYIMAHTHL